MRLNRYIALCGICSRRAADTLISAGKVKINGKIGKLGDTVTNNDIIEVNDG
ncbi:MAG: ribosomal large subunit pseudouridine synthase B, partial [Candidatus Nomurabacteria bacterium GW2011_GWA2_40_9]